MNGKILIADSNRSEVRVLAKMLAAEGHEVLEAADGSEAVSAVRQHRPDLLLLNTSFPPDVGHGGGAFCDGFLVIEWLKRTDEDGGLSFIMITEDDAAGLAARARASGARGLFQKPLDYEALLGLTRQIFAGTTAEPDEAVPDQSQ